MGFTSMETTSCRLKTVFSDCMHCVTPFYTRGFSIRGFGELQGWGSGTNPRGYGGMTVLSYYCAIADLSHAGQVCPSTAKESQQQGCRPELCLGGGRQTAGGRGYLGIQLLPLLLRRQCRNPKPLLFCPFSRHRHAWPALLRAAGGRDRETGMDVVWIRSATDHSGLKLGLQGLT